MIGSEGAKTNMTRLRGWCARGQPLVHKVPHGHWRTLTFLAALRHDRNTARRWMPCANLNRWRKSARHSSGSSGAYTRVKAQADQTPRQRRGSLQFVRRQRDGERRDALQPFPLFGVQHADEGADTGQIRPQLRPFPALVRVARRRRLALSRARARRSLPRLPPPCRLRLPRPPFRRPAARPAHHSPPIVRSARFQDFPRARAYPRA